MERQTRTISDRDAYLIASNLFDLSDLNSLDLDDIGFEVIKREIVIAGIDNNYYSTILKEKLTGKYFNYKYNDKDVDSTDYLLEYDQVLGKCWLSNTLFQIFPEEFEYLFWLEIKNK